MRSSALEARQYRPSGQTGLFGRQPLRQVSSAPQIKPLGHSGSDEHSTGMQRPVVSLHRSAGDVQSPGRQASRSLQVPVSVLQTSDSGQGSAGQRCWIGSHCPVDGLQEVSGGQPDTEQSDSVGWQVPVDSLQTKPGSQPSSSQVRLGGQPTSQTAASMRPTTGHGPGAGGCRSGGAVVIIRERCHGAT